MGVVGPHGKVFRLVSRTNLPSGMRRVTAPVAPLNLPAIFNSGQTFRWRRCPAVAPVRSSDCGLAHYGVVEGRALLASYADDTLCVDVLGESPQDAPMPVADWLSRYFDLATDYYALAESLVRIDPFLTPALASLQGLRILRQDPWETLITFILSANNNIPRICGIIERLSERLGTPIPMVEGSDLVLPPMFAFPNPCSVARADETVLRACGAGYRAPYVRAVAQRIFEGAFDLAGLFVMPIGDARDALMTLPGVGRKVADCVLLFGYGKTHAFPIDVWAKRSVEQVYFGGAERPIKQLLQFVEERFGPLAGHAQNYLFNFKRLSKDDGLAD